MSCFVSGAGPSPAPLHLWQVWQGKGDLQCPVMVIRPTPQGCSKCGAATEFLSFIPRFGERPAYRIFECGTCKALTWIAEKVGA